LCAAMEPVTPRMIFFEALILPVIALLKSVKCYAACVGGGYYRRNVEPFSASCKSKFRRLRPRRAHFFRFNDRQGPPQILLLAAADEQVIKVFPL